MNKEHEFITGKKKKGEEEKIDRIKPERHYLPLRPAERKNEKKKKKERKKERKKGTPAGGATFADLRLPSTFARGIVFPARYRSNRITLDHDPFSANLRIERHSTPFHKS